MAGQYLEPNSDVQVQDIQDKAVELNYTRHGEMFSALNMSKLAMAMYDCEATKVKGSYEVLTKLDNLLRILSKEEQLILGNRNCNWNFWIMD